MMIFWTAILILIVFILCYAITGALMRIDNAIDECFFIGRWIRENKSNNQLQPTAKRRGGQE